jgi:hypothetical protein
LSSGRRSLALLQIKGLDWGVKAGGADDKLTSIPAAFISLPCMSTAMLHSHRSMRVRCRGRFIGISFVELYSHARHRLISTQPHENTAPKTKHLNGKSSVA